MWGLIVMEGNLERRIRSKSIRLYLFNSESVNESKRKTYG